MENPIDLVRRFCAAWGDGLATADLAAFFAEDAIYHNIPLEPVVGKAAIAANINGFIRPGPPGIEGIEFRVLNIVADGPVVMTERVDVFRLADRSFEPAGDGDLRGRRRQDPGLAGLLRHRAVRGPDGLIALGN
jgi:limonene-1,2-epoxide hydrolase